MQTMRTNYLYVLIFIVFYFNPFIANGQYTIDSAGRVWPIPFVKWDTVKAESENCVALHFHLVSRENLSTICSLKNEEDIFVDSINNFSRLIIKNHIGPSFDIPTIPLSYIYILEKQKIIVCLSNYEVSPYHLVLYSLDDGRLLYKRHFYRNDFKFNKDELKQLVRKCPEVISCFEQKPNVIKVGDDYIIEATQCLIKLTMYDSVIREKNMFANTSLLFYDMTLSTASPISGDKYKMYHYFFDKADPLADLITINSVPYMLILNDWQRRKVNIPLLSNCNILEELK